MRNILVYDHEIERAISTGREQRIDGIEYCDGWRDFENMGISVTGVYDYLEERYRIFCIDNRDQLQALIDRSAVVVGFNNQAFDDPLSAAHGIVVPPEKSFDLLVEIWKAAGLGPEFNADTHRNFGLDACAQANFGTGKTGNGALAPVLWQKGEIGTVIDYCLRDVELTKRLIDRVLCRGELVDPRDHEKTLNMNKAAVTLMAMAFNG